MTSRKTVTQLVIMLLTLALSNVLFAEESVKNAHKDNGAGNTISDANATGHVDGDFSSAVTAKAMLGAQQKMTGDIHSFREMQKRHRQLREAQLARYKHYLKQRRQQSASYQQTQRKAFIRLMEDRRTLMKKMLDEHRQAAERRRESMLLKMHQTSTTPVRLFS